MRYLESACGVAAGWQCSPVALAPWLRVAALLGTWRGRSTHSQPRKSCFKTNPLFCQITAVFTGGARQVIAALYCSCCCCCFVNGCTFMVSASSLGESRSLQRWKTEKDIMFRHRVLWVKHLRSLIMMTYSQKVFFSEVFLYSLGDHVPAVTLLRTAGYACLPLISILSSLETC